MDFEMNINGTPVSYISGSGELTVGEEKVQLGEGLKDFHILVDAEIMEVSADHYLKAAILEIPDREEDIQVKISKEAEIEIFEII